MKIIEKFFDYMIHTKEKKLQQLKMQCIQDNYKLEILKHKNSDLQHSLK